MNVFHYLWLICLILAISLLVRQKQIYRARQDIIKAKEISNKSRLAGSSVPSESQAYFLRKQVNDYLTKINGK